MSTFETLMISAISIKTAEEWGYVLGCVNTEYAHNFINKLEYDVLFQLIQNKKGVR